MEIYRRNSFIVEWVKGFKSQEDRKVLVSGNKHSIELKEALIIAKALFDSEDIIHSVNDGWMGSYYFKQAFARLLEGEEPEKIAEVYVQKNKHPKDAHLFNYKDWVPIFCDGCYKPTFCSHCGKSVWIKKNEIP